MAESRQDKDFHPDRHRNELSIFRISLFSIKLSLYPIIHEKHTPHRRTLLVVIISLLKYNDT